MVTTCRCGARWSGHKLEQTCSIPECEAPPRSGKALWCEKHYARNRRHGHPLAISPSRTGVTLTEHGYRLIAAPTRPLANSEGRVYEHRLVLFAVIGPGSHQCG